MRDIYKRMLERRCRHRLRLARRRPGCLGRRVDRAGGDIAAMARRRRSARRPDLVGGENIQKDLRRKVVNDAIGLLKALAESHDRNVEWVEQAVRQASNLTASEALEQNVV